MTDATGKPRMFKLLAAVGLVGGLMIWGLWPSRPTGLSTDIHSHISTPASLYLSLNGRTVVDGSIRGRGETGGATYGSRWGDALNWDLAWYDILADRSYRLKFTISASELATFGEDGSHATIDIVVGPGADIIATTTDHEVARLIGLRQTEDVSALQKPRIILRELCAEPLPDDDPLAQKLKETSQANGWADQLKESMENRARFLSNNEAPQPRCSGTGGS